MAKDFVGVPPPVGAQAQPIYVRWPKPGHPLDVTLLENVPYGLAVHWVLVPGKDYRQMRRCNKPDTCAHHEMGVPSAWACFIAGYDHDTRKPIACVFGPDSWRSLERLLVDDEPLRGVRVLCTRSATHRSSPILYSRKTLPLNPMPDAPDIRPCLRLLFGADLFPDDPTDNGHGDAWEGKP